MNVLPAVVHAEYRGEFTIRVVFNDGVEATIDFSYWLPGPIFSRRTRIGPGTCGLFVLVSRKWAALAKCSPDTALRDITEVLDRGVLGKSTAGGRSTSYELDEATR